MKRWLTGGVTALATLVALLLSYSHTSHPPLPRTLALEITFPRGDPGRTEPLICTGMWREGDLLNVYYLGETTAEFRYDHWGHGGPASSRVTFTPGTRHALQVEMPSLITYAKPPDGARARLRVVFDGREVLNTATLYYGRQPKQLFFGHNPIGASTAAAFRGDLRRADGHKPGDGSVGYFSAHEKIRVWVHRNPWRTLRLVLLSGAAGWFTAWLIARPLTQALFARVRATALATAAWLARHVIDTPRTIASSLPRPAFALPLVENAASVEPLQPVCDRRARAWFVGSSAVAAIGYAWIVTLGTFNFNYSEVFGDFYDYQAQSFLEGRLDVPEAAIGGEAFEARGKLYGYFGPTPSLLRLPFVIAGVAFGKLSRAFMLLYFVGALVAAFLLYCDALRLARTPGRAVVANGESRTISVTAAGTSGFGRPARASATGIVILVASAGLGSTIFFLGSRGLIFHEAILCGITFALWSCWCTLRYLRAPASRWWIGGLVCGLLSLHARPPTGMFALTLLGCVAALLALAFLHRARVTAETLRRPLWRRHIAIGALSVIGFVSLNGLAWLKFRTFDPAPLRLSRPYTVPGRLEHIDGKSFHLANVPYNVDAYFLFPNFSFHGQFPWFYLVSGEPRRSFPRARIDLPDHTLAVPYSMPSLFALATLGSLAAFLGLVRTRAAIAVLWLAALPMSFALMCAVATAQRYTGDFVPILIGCGVFGLVAIEFARPRWRRACHGAGLLLTVAAVAVTAAITLHYQGAVLWGVPEETRQNYERLRRNVDALFGLASPPPPRNTE